MKQRIGQLLLDTLAVNGVDKMFGVPGDFTLAFLDDVVRHDKIEWIGNTNELNAAYAADGYARVKGLAAVSTTFGVGELSAVNGIAGSYAERVPVVKIAGGPSSIAQQEGRYVHHSLGEGVFDAYSKMYEHITCATTTLTVENAQTEIPRVINAAIRERRPVHIHLPIDVALTEIEVTDAPVAYQHAAKDVSQYIEAVKERLSKAKQPVFIVGHEINSFDLHDKLEQLADLTNIPVAQLSLGKSAFNEENNKYLGIFDGKIAEENVRNYVNNSDCIINLGAKLTDSATAGFSYEFDVNDVIFMNQNDFKAGSVVSDDVSIIDLVDGLLTLDYKNSADYPKFKRSEMDYVLNDEPLVQENYFKLVNAFLEKDDILLAEQGTSFFGAYDLSLYKGNQYIGQPLWGSIGYTFPALLGSQHADVNRRNLLLIGDGSLQLTVQALSTMIRTDIKPIIFVINNDGYTVERLIHGMEEPYNDIKMWNYKQLPETFGAKDEVVVHDAKTSNELKAVMDKIKADKDHLHFVEIHMAVQDAPKKLIDISKAFAEANKKA
ncbi:alpha-keto acid decarboxylase family protein [Macrococcoides goetzii]|nr:alpha-keto acid decarboxylase family protein [Macrococcus goetzii]TDM39822.1 alpha-keto acid decarboxylase family protein [Macrococcus goetzii]TDM46301.1 alpha-keto acid decarboxylase family protein [Macrococcus goetzii]TDM49787.1 alpha-keto acid decarboxylase family protein [Macrococcus goetzii]